MKDVIRNISKTSVVKAVLVAMVAAVISNVLFNNAFGLVLSGKMVNVLNNGIDVAQLLGYTTAKLVRNRSLNRFDMPFIIGGIVAIVM